ncbi:MULTISPECIES: DUF2905 domain-containing protein [Shouchella]|uniref:DUF2905 domain-containing protein n=2 Tax=Shouchella TaxID=2893057 RepID=A0ABY7W4Q3_9BACI|nr:MULTISPECIES: DUF2905 domain-containing protein [Shouchella]MED4130057.1 DUF2905 domain-containing protein [Shouchella miscanthi]WDF02862.1 DUF2905 domain-containing protein [Shouchella hunanensis]GAF24512.1 hypothetical protein JCM19047_4418 [Bacillus sp. JCM 19047]
MGRTLMIVGAIILAIGLIWELAGRFIPLGKLPGDFLFKSGNTTIYFPIVTCIIISVVLSLILSFIRR